MPPNTRSVARPSKWGNPFRIGQTLHGIVLDARLVVELYDEYLDHAIPRANGALDLSTLRGKNLACYCPPEQPCHVDVLLRRANQNGEQ